MSALSIQVPFPVFQDRDGQPLDNGYVWLGTSSLNPQTNPVVAYYDSALTIVATQPLRTLNGFISRAGSPAQVYVDAVNFSILVQDRQGTTVFSVPEGTGISPNASGVVYNPAGTGAVATTVQAKLRESVSVKDFGAVGDGVTDDSIARDKAFDYCIANGIALKVEGKIRVTYGYTNSTIKGDLLLIGSGVDYAAGTVAQINNACFILDSTDPASFFYKHAADTQLTVRDLVFACNQYVLDREFFVSISAMRHNFDNVNFVAVEQPFVFDSGTYFQMSSYRNVRFTGSGSFHSKVTTLIGTLMLIENCDVEGTVPANTEKIICNLGGIREIQATNFLIEPAVPALGWTALYLQNAYDPTWIRFITATLRGFWIEVTGFALTYAVNQIGGRSLFIAPVLNNGAAAPFRLASMAAIEFHTASFSGSSDELQTYFTLADYMCQVKLTNCNYRAVGTALTNPQFTFDNCSNSPSAAAGGAPFTATSHNNQQSELLWAFDGGYPDAGKVQLQTFGSSTARPSTDATFGRALVLDHSGGVIQVRFQARMRAAFPQGGQMFFVMRGKMPTFASNVLEIYFMVDGVSIGGGKVYTTASSGADFTLVLPVTAPTANPTLMGVEIGCATASSTMLLYQMELWIGKSLPSVILPSYPTNVVTYAAASPSTGTWAVGDIAKNTTPAVGQPKGWVCTVAGTPGTWVSEGNL